MSARVRPFFVISHFFPLQTVQRSPPARPHAAAGDGARCVIPFRGDDMEWRDLRVMGDLGMIVPMPFSPLDDASIRATIRNSDVVINLAGKDYETTHYAPNLKNFTFYDVNVTFAEKIAKICAEEVPALLPCVCGCDTARLLAPLRSLWPTLSTCQLLVPASTPSPLGPNPRSVDPLLLEVARPPVFACGLCGLFARLCLRVV